MLEDDEDLLTTGEFARQDRLTPMAVRLYGRLGLLRLAAVNETTSYRYYHVAQVRTGQVIGLLRGAWSHCSTRSIAAAPTAGY